MSIVATLIAVYFYSRGRLSLTFASSIIIAVNGIMDFIFISADENLDGGKLYWPC